jgi:hypothetical protein
MRGNLSSGVSSSRRLAALLLMRVINSPYRAGLRLSVIGGMLGMRLAEASVQGTPTPPELT